MELQILTAFIIYFCILMGIGFFFYKRNKTETDFIIGGRSVNYWVTAIATQASDMSSWLFLAFPAAIYAHGLSEAWTAIGLVVGMFCNWHFIAPKLRTATEEYNSLTLSSFFESRFNDTSGVLRTVSAFFALIFFTFYIASSLVGLGRLFESAFGLTYHAGIVVGLASAIMYTLIGGFIAVAWCDLFQGLFLLCMIVLVPSYSLYLFGGWEPVLTAARSNNVSLSLFPSFSGVMSSLLLAASWGLGYFGQPHILTNFMGIDDANNIKYAKRVGITWQIIVLSAAVCIGLVGLAYFPTGMSEAEELFVIITKSLFAPLLAGFVLCGILAATLSTLDSHILNSGSIIAEDVYKRCIGHTASAHTIMWTSRAGSIVVSFIALFIARTNSSSIYELVNYSWAGLGSSFGPLVIMALYGGKNITRNAAIAGLIVGGVTSGVWPYLGTGILPLVPGFSLGLLTIWGVSKLSTR